MTEKEFKHFFNINFDSLRSYLYYRSGDSELATDLAQDTFLRIWEKNVKNEGKKTVGLAYKIAGDIFVSRYRRANTEANYMKTLAFEFSNTTPEEVMQYRELKEKYEKTLADMPEKKRVVFLMSRMEGLKYKEISERLGISVKAVEKRMHGAIANFRDVLQLMLYVLYFSLYFDRVVLMFNEL